MNRTIIVTGASSGIGRELVKLLVTGDDCLVVVGRNRTTLQEAIGSVKGEVVVADLAKTGSAEKVMEAARKLSPTAYPVLVNCAGTAHFGDFATMPLELIEQQVELNLLAPIRLTQAFVPWALENGEGQVINVLSIASTTVFSGSVGYCASKAGALMFSRVLAAEYRSKGLRVSSVLPGSVDTPLWADKEWRPAAEDMLAASSVAQSIYDLIQMPLDRNVDELVLMPPKGIL